MKPISTTIILGLAFLLCGCFRSPYQGVTQKEYDRLKFNVYTTEETELPESDRSAVAYSAFDYALCSETKQDKDLFIGICTNLFHEEDPPEIAQQMLRKKGYKILPFSMAKIPDPDPKDLRICPDITNRITGKAGVLVSLNMDCVVDKKNTVLVKLYRRTNIVWDNEEYVLVRHFEDGWKAEKPLAQIPTKIKNELLLWGFDYLLFPRENQVKAITEDGDCFVGIYNKHDASEYADPPESVLRSLKQAGYIVLPCSQARLPKDGENDPHDPSRLRGVENAITGRHGVLAYIQINAAFSHNLMLIETVHFQAPLAGHGERILMRKNRGKWEIIKLLEGWLS